MASPAPLDHPWHTSTSGTWDQLLPWHLPCPGALARRDHPQPSVNTPGSPLGSLALPDTGTTGPQHVWDSWNTGITGRPASPPGSGAPPGSHPGITARTPAPLSTRSPGLFRAPFALKITKSPLFLSQVISQLPKPWESSSMERCWSTSGDPAAFACLLTWNPPHHIYSFQY